MHNNRFPRPSSSRRHGAVLEARASRGRLAIGLTLAALASAACGSEPPPAPGGNSNWLHVCGGDSDCSDGYECVCGVCTRQCEAAAECRELNPAAACARVDEDSSCAPRTVAAVCALPCLTSKDCLRDLGAGFECVQDRCLPDDAHADSSPIDAGAENSPDDAGVPGAVLDATLPDIEIRDSSSPVVDPVRSIGPSDKSVEWPVVVVCDELRASTPPERIAGVDVIARDLADLSTYAVTSSALFYARGSDDGIYRAMLDGSEPSLVAQDTLTMGGVRELRADEEAVVWGETDGFRVPVMSMPIATGRPVMLSPSNPPLLANLSGLVLSSQDVFWFVDGMLARSPRTPGATQTLVSDLPAFNPHPNLALAGEWLYYVISPTDEHWSSPRSLFRIPTSGGDPTPLLEDVQIGGFVVDGETVYFTQPGTRDSLGRHQGDGRIARLAAGAQEPETVLPTTAEPLALALHEGRLYWLERNIGGDATSMWRVEPGSDEPQPVLAFDDSLNYTDVAPTFAHGDLYWTASCGETFLLRIALR